MLEVLRHRPFYLGGCRGVESPASAGGVSREDCVTQDKNRYYTLILAKRPRSALPLDQTGSL